MFALVFTIVIFILDCINSHPRPTATIFNVESKLALTALRQNKSANKVVTVLPIRFLLCKLATVAKDETKKELLSFLEYKSDSMLKNCYTDIKEVIDYLKWSDLLMFSKIYVNYTSEINQDFVTNSSELYGVHVDKVGFNMPSSAVTFINRWIETATYRRIKDVLDRNDIDRFTSMILINVAHFKITWEFPFDVKNTINRKFHYFNKTTTMIPMMMKVNEFRYYADKLNGLQILTMNLGCFGTTLTYVMPDNPDGLPRLLNKLSDQPEFLTVIKQAMIWTRMKIGLPRMKIKTTVDWIDPLKKIGVKSIFNKTTSSLSIYKTSNKTRNVSVNKIRQKLFMELDEMGVSRHRSPMDPELMGRSPIFLGPGINVLEFILDRPVYFVVTASIENIQHDLFNGVFYGP